MESLFGWSNLASQAPPKVESIESLFTQLNKQKNNSDIVLCIDTSGSTAFKTTFTPDRVDPSSAAVTFPVIVRSCDSSGGILHCKRPIDRGIEATRA